MQALEWEGSFLGCGELYLLSVLPSPQSRSLGRKWEPLAERSAMASAQEKGQEGVVSLKRCFGCQGRASVSQLLSTASDVLWQGGVVGCSRDAWVRILLQPHSPQGELLDKAVFSPIPTWFLLFECSVQSETGCLTQVLALISVTLFMR